MSDRAPDSGDHERHEPYAWHEPTQRHEQEHTQSHAGNGTVNDGPDEKGPEGLGPDELALRRMLHSAVDSMEPRDGTLDHLRRAVPARRARKRQATVGMVAAALFVGTAIPALVHVSHSTGSPNTSIAGQASQAQGGTGQGKDPAGGVGSVAGSEGHAAKEHQQGRKHGDKGKGGASSTAGSTAGAGPSASTDAGAPLCTAEQLGGTATADAPDSAGVVYGTFRVANISATRCSVAGVGTVGAVPYGAADPARIATARHVAGDAATSLPDPSTELTSLVLLPGSAYEEKFAFVPSGACPTPGTGGTGGTDGGTPTDSPTTEPSPPVDAGTTSGSDDGAPSGTSPQMVTEEGPADGSIGVSHTPAPGGPTVSTTVGNACAGTVYWTGLLPGA
ncbi:hypothetical protein [Streptomyces sp. V3I7]|uniref:hypothetical protein n=1 Tax=Streptomyces sp. V3I7 TaxID=3042278 RepID=UPI00277DD7AB|nr:hypothetical protein [Streptomyces sp. V3I7]MDQ0992090.1 hypothetical protein [Streptomyces sp. V3I7]